MSKELEELLTVEFLSEVLGKDVDSFEVVDAWNRLEYFADDERDVQYENLDTLTRKMKEWALKKTTKRETQERLVAYSVVCTREEFI